jgi:hypothetical protein
MDAYVKAFWLPKDGSTEEEYEDAFSPKHSSSVTGQRLRFAVADGATEASFSKFWARLLVRAFVRRALTLPLTLEQLVPLQEQWAAAVHGRTLPWYAEEKAASGAFSSLLGLELSEDASTGKPQRTWRATAAGDSCLIQVAREQITAAFPLKESAAFSNRPDLLGSLRTNPPGVDEGGFILESRGTWACDDQFFLMTDALACWFLKQSELGKKPWSILNAADADGLASFREFIIGLRREGALKNDDVTLLKIDILG